MDRRAVLVWLSAWPLAARAQRPIPFVGFLNSGAPNERAHLVEAFRQGLREGGYVDGKNVAIEYRWAEGRPERLPKLAAELVERNVAVIVTTGGVSPATAAKAATESIPVVFTIGDDPVKLGLVASLSHPRGNVTGVTNGAGQLNRKRLEVLKQLLPRATKFVYLANPKNVGTGAASYDIMAAAEAMRVDVEIVHASTENEIDNVFAAMKQMRANALVVASDPLFVTRRDQIVALATRHAIPASYPFREFPLSGGLMSYGPDIRAGYRQAGVYATRILKGARPADLPVVQVNKIELVVNLKAAKQLGVAFSAEFLARVDEVIQ